MREHGLLFTDEMVRALLSGRKTQTRRPLLPQPVFEQLYEWRGEVVHDGSSRMWCWREHVIDGCCNLGTMQAALAELLPVQGGDRVWARETQRPRVAHSHGDNACDCGDVLATYAADGAERFFNDREVAQDWTLPKAAARGCVPSIHMPRWAARLVFDVERVRIERVADITEDDARAEGVEPVPAHGRWCDPAKGREGHWSARPAFAALWDSVYASRGLGWDASPWVVVYDLRRIDGAERAAESAS